jgi:hypothetical protein
MCIWAGMTHSDVMQDCTRYIRLLHALAPQRVPLALVEVCPAWLAFTVAGCLVGARWGGGVWWGSCAR